MHESPLVRALLNLSNHGDTVVLVLLIFLSVWATAVIIERSLYFRKRLPEVEDSVARIRTSLDANKASSDWMPPSAGALGDLFASLWNGNHDSASAQARIHSAGGVFRRDLMRRTNILGTLGATAPFIGLLGTVCGIIQSFQNLAETANRSTNAVMGGIAEALVATGMGLLVAIPCVVAYNYFSRRAAQTLEEVEEVAGWLASVRRGL